MHLSREAYVMAKVLMALDELKEHGYVAGGLDIDREACRVGVEEFESDGNEPMTDDEMRDAVAYLRAGGQRERDFPVEA